MDFVNNLDTDTSLSILSCLDDPSDIVRASAVSRSWRQFGILFNVCYLLLISVLNLEFGGLEFYLSFPKNSCFCICSD